MAEVEPGTEAFTSLDNEAPIFVIPENFQFQEHETHSASVANLQIIQLSHVRQTKDSFKLLRFSDQDFFLPLGCFDSKIPTAHNPAQGPQEPWRSVRIWWLIRLTGKWPVPLLATANCSITLPCCNTCGLLEIPVNSRRDATCPPVQSRRSATRAPSQHPLRKQQNRRGVCGNFLG